MSRDAGFQDVPWSVRERSVARRTAVIVCTVGVVACAIGTAFVLDAQGPRGIALGVAVGVVAGLASAFDTLRRSNGLCGRVDTRSLLLPLYAGALALVPGALGSISMSVLLPVAIPGVGLIAAGVAAGATLIRRTG